MPEPAPVVIANPEPIPVKVAEAVTPAESKAHSDARVIAAKDATDERVTRAGRTADEAALVSHGQRTVNLIWETTQRWIALIIVIPTMIVSAIIVIAVAARDNPTAQQAALGLAAFTLLATLAGSVIGYYFGRTNHARTGGVGGADVTTDR